MSVIRRIRRPDGRNGLAIVIFIILRIVSISFGCVVANIEVGKVFGNVLEITVDIPRVGDDCNDWALEVEVDFATPRGIVVIVVLVDSATDVVWAQFRWNQGFSLSLDFRVGHEPISVFVIARSRRG